MKNKQFFILILLLVIGFASISATLIINGNTKVAANLDDFNVIFIEAFLDGEESPNVEIDSTKKILTFTTNRLTNKGDNTRIDYKVKNISTQYDGDVTINCTNETNGYVSVTSSFDGKSLPLTEPINMQAQEVKSGYINSELTKATTEEQEVKITCKIEVGAVSRMEYAYSLVFDSDGGSKVDDKSVALNESYGELSVPEKDGYTFIGWFNEDEVKVDSNTVFDSKGNRTLHAKWDYTCPYETGEKWEFNFRGEEQEFHAPCDGNYKVELWGAGGSTNSSTYYAGKGGYVSGVVPLTRQTYFVNVGGSNGFNGGNGTESYWMSGGASDFRLISNEEDSFTSLKSRIIVAAGGGAGGDFALSSWYYTGYGGNAGGLQGYNGVSGSKNSCGTGGQSGGAKQNGVLNNYNGKGQQVVATAPQKGDFGMGSVLDRAGGGGGYYGGNGTGCMYGGGGGSSFISGHNGCDAIAENSTSSNITHTGQPNHYSGLVFTDTIMVDGAGYKWTNVKGSYTGMPTHDGTSTMTGNTGNGYAKITYLGK